MDSAGLSELKQGTQVSHKGPVCLRIDDAQNNIIKH